MEKTFNDKDYYTGFQITESHDRGEKRGVKSDEIGALANLLVRERKRLKLSPEQLAKDAEIDLNDLIDLELRSMHPYEAVTIAEKLRKVMNIDDEKYRLALHNIYPNLEDRSKMGRLPVD